MRKQEKIFMIVHNLNGQVVIVLPNYNYGRRKYRIEKSSTDDFIMKGKLGQPAMLLITDSYSKGWRV